MILIAESKNRRTLWVAVEGGHIERYAETSGLNPYFKSRREISHVIRLELPEWFFHNKFSHVYFYGAGCANGEKNKIVESSLIAQFRTTVSVGSDLLGAARGMLRDSKGIACIMSTGSNSCFYNGEVIVKNVRPGGFILGDEGSNSYMGKVLLADLLKGIAPKEVSDRFFGRFSVTIDDILDDVYSTTNVNLTLAYYSDFIADNLDIKYCKDLVYKSFMIFFKRNIQFYEYKKYGMSVMGAACCKYKDILLQAAVDFGVKINQIEETALKGLVEYHSKDSVIP